eukprot:15126690-Alexandrium_andersonii.AAC.1
MPSLKLRALGSARIGGARCTHPQAGPEKARRSLTLAPRRSPSHGAFHKLWLLAETVHAGPGVLIKP